MTTIGFIRSNVFVFHREVFELHTRHGHPVPLYGMRIALCCWYASAAVLH